MSASIWNIFEGMPIYYQNKLRNLDFFDNLTRKALDAKLVKLKKAKFVILF